MNPYHQHSQSGYPQQPYQKNIGLCNTAPQSFGNPMPMPGIATMGYPAPQSGQPNTSGSYSSPNQGNTAPQSFGNPMPGISTTGYLAPQAGQPNTSGTYSSPNQGNTAPQSFGNPMPMPGIATMGYPAPQAGQTNTSGTHSLPNQGNTAAQTFGNPLPMPRLSTMGYPALQAGHPSTSGSYSSLNQGNPQSGYPQPNSGYPSSQSYAHSAQAYPTTPQGYPQPTQIVNPQPQGQPQHQPLGQYQGYPQTQPNMQSHQAYIATMGLPSNVPKSKPTVVPAKSFDPRKDAEVLRKAMKGFGTDEKSIIQVLTRRSNEQRLRIAAEFKTLYGKDLVSDLKSETSGRFEDLLVALMTPVPQFYAKELHDATAGLGTDEDVLIEVMCSMSNYEIQVIKQDYTAMYKTMLEDDLRGDTSGNFKRLMTSLCMGNRSEEFHVDKDKAREDAKSLLQAGKLRLGTDESVFNAVLCSRSFPQLAAIFQEYQNLTGDDIDKAIKSEFSGDMQKALRAIVKVVRNKPLFFAELLQKSMKGLGTNDRQLIRIMVTRCEVDLGDIADIFLSKYGKTLQSWIEGDCSGHYKKCLLGLLGI